MDAHWKVQNSSELFRFLNCMDMSELSSFKKVVPNKEVRLYIPDWCVRQISLFLHLVCIAPRHKHPTGVKHLAAHAQHKCSNNSNKCGGQGDMVWKHAQTDQVKISQTRQPPLQKKYHHRHRHQLRDAT